MGVSVVVATMNPGTQLQRCLQSIQSQTGVEKEIIVVDGGSTDGTVEWLQAAGKQLKVWLPGPDRGIYDAWNKALPHCSMRWVAFLGADDYFASPFSLAKVVAAGQSSGAALVFSKIAYVSENGVRIKDVGSAWNWYLHRFRQRVAHPGALHLRELFDQYGSFDPNLKIVGDYEFLLRLPKETPATFVDIVTVIAGAGGISQRDVMKGFEEARLVQAANPDMGPLIAGLFHHIKVAKRGVRIVMDFMLAKVRP